MFDILSEKVDGALKHLTGKSKLSESNIQEALDEVKIALLEADVNFKVVKSFIQDVKEKAIGEKVISGVNPRELFIKIMHDELAKIMGEANEELNLSKPFNVVLIVGLNGAGKTTFSGKLALHLRQKKTKEFLLVPADTFRPAAKKQLEILANGIAVDCFDSDLNKHPKDIAREAIEFAKKNNKSGVIIDTAGRLHVDLDLMNQIKEVKDSLAQYQPEVLLVADAMTGQEAVSVAKSFHETIQLTGVILSKMDSDARGGAALSIRHSTGVPIRYISTGEKMKDLELFHPDRLAKRILDMGDVVSLVEKAQEVIDEKEAEKMMKKMEKSDFTMEDFVKQMDMINSLGPMESLLKMIPGMGGALRSVGDLSPAKEEMKKMKVIISSMTTIERRNDKLLDQKSRVQRIAKGSGTAPSDVDSFVTKFRQMQKMMKGMMGMLKGGMPSLPGMPGMDMGGNRKGFRQNTDGPGREKKKSKGGRGGPFGKYF